MTLRTRLRRWCFLLTSYFLQSQSAQATVAASITMSRLVEADRPTRGDNRRLNATVNAAKAPADDRHHDADLLDATALASAASMSLVLPATSPFPASIDPDTRDFSVNSMAVGIGTDFPSLTDAIKDVLVTRLEELRDNDWGRRGRGVGPRARDTTIPAGA